MKKAASDFGSFRSKMLFKVQIHILSLLLLLLISQPGQCQQPIFNSERAFQLLEKQCEFGPRNPGSEGYAACREWLAESLEGTTEEVYRQTFDIRDQINNSEYRLTNIIARFEGNNSYPLMLCAHWDTRPWADMESDTAKAKMPIIGANDGASGVAVLLEMAHIFADNPPPRTVIITLFDGEDMGRSGHPEEYALGSQFWARHQVPEEPVEAILLDMIGDADLEIPIEPYSDVGAPDLRKQLWDLAAHLQLPAFVDFEGPAVQDDHVHLLRVGIKAVDLIDFDYPYWHTLEDTPDKCSAVSLNQIGRLLIAFIYGQ